MTQLVNVVQIMNAVAQRAYVNLKNHIATNFPPRKTLDQAAPWTDSPFYSNVNQRCHILGQTFV